MKDVIKQARRAQSQPEGPLPRSRAPEGPLDFYEIYCVIILEVGISVQSCMKPPLPLQKIETGLKFKSQPTAI